MKLKRLFMPMFVLGVMLLLGSVVYGQSVTCAVGEAGPDQSAGVLTAGSTAITGVPAPTGGATATGHTEPAGAGPTGVPAVPGGGLIRVACAPVVAGNPGVLVLTLSFGVPITNSTTYPTAATGIRLGNGTQDFITNGAGANVGISSVNNNAGTITIGLGTPAAAAGPPAVTPGTGITFTASKTSTFDIAGVLLSVCGNASSVTAACPLTPSSITATLVASPAASASAGTVPNNGNALATPTGGGNFGAASATVITTVASGISSLGLAANGALPAGVVFPAAVCTGTGSTACQGGPATLLSSGTPTHSSFVLKVTEGFAGEFKGPAQFNGGGAAVVPTGSQGVEVWIKLSNVPTGFSIGNCTGVVTTDATGATADASPGFGTSVAQLNSAGQIKVAFVGARSAASLALQETLWVGCSVGVGTATTPLSTAITAQAEIGPIAGTALAAPLNSVQTGLGVGNVPRYEDILTPATGVTVVVFPPSQTTLLVPFAVVAPGINTGIAVANTSTDIFGAANGGATPTAGTITFTMYPQAGGTPLTFTTASIASGSTYANNLSGILPSGTTTFTGYVFITANFPAAHGSATIYDATTGHAELSAPVLVVGTAAGNITPVNPRPSPESLGQ